MQGKDERRPEKKRCCCAIGKCCDSRLSTRALADIRACLRSALNNAKDADQLISRNPAQTVKLPAVRKKRGKAWSSDEARRFLESARDDEDPLYAAYVLVLILGLRRGEALGLTWDDVDWNGWDEFCGEHGRPYCLDCRDRYDSAELTVEHQLQRVAGKLYHRETKTDASDATLPVPGICTTAFALRRARQQEDAQTAGVVWQGSKLVFTTRLGTPVEPRNFNRSFHARCAKAGVRRIKVHDARRTCASLLADLDVHPRVVMQILRHAQFSVTMEIYTQVSSTKTREALKRLGDSLDG